MMKRTFAYIMVGVTFTLIFTFTWITFASPKPVRSDNTVSMAADSSLNIQDFHLRMAFKPKGNYEIDYDKNEQGAIDCHVKKNSSDSSEHYESQKAINYTEALLRELALTPAMKKDDVLTRIQNVLDIDLSTLKTVDLDVKFTDTHSLELHEDFQPHKK